MVFFGGTVLPCTFIAFYVCVNAVILKCLLCDGYFHLFSNKYVVVVICY